MADLNTAIYDYLLTKSDITDETSTIRLSELHQDDTMPAIVMWRVSGTHVDNINGSFGGLCQARVTIEAMAATAAGAQTLAEAIRKAMIDFRGTRSGVKIRSCNVDEAQNDYTVRPNDGDNILRYVKPQDFAITFVEDVS